MRLTIIEILPSKAISGGVKTISGGVTVFFAPVILSAVIFYLQQYIFFFAQKFTKDPTLLYRFC